MTTGNQQYPLVSVVAVSYNHTKYVEETLDSILNQSYPKIQLIIIDDHSKDTSVDVIRSWISKNKVDCQFIPHQVNQGVCRTLNQALSICNGKYIQLISCDDKMMPEKLIHQVNILNKAPLSTKVVYSDAYLINDKSKRLKGTHIEKDIGPLFNSRKDNIYKALLEGSNFIPAMAALIRLDVFQKVGYYDEKLSYEDLDMWLRISKDYDFVYSDYISVEYRRHEDNFSTKLFDNLKHLKSRYRIFRKHFKKNGTYSSLVEDKLLFSIDQMQKVSIKSSIPFILDYLLIGGNFNKIKLPIKRVLKGAKDTFLQAFSSKKKSKT